MNSSGRVVLPSAFEDADIDNLALLIADMLERLMAHNDQIPLLAESLTRFHSRAVPSINVLDYLRRIIKFTKVEKTCLLLTLHYVDQICARTPLFTLSSLTCHRFIIASITVCNKGLCDTFCTNSFYARVGGIPVSELNDLEREFLRMIDWRLTCTREVLQEYYINLVRTDSTGRFSILGIDMESTATSRSPSPPAMSPAPVPMSHQHRSIRREASTILIDTATLTPQVPQGPTVEQNMAFADLQKSWGGMESESAPG
ncbi:cyclin-domain-containing protein [Pisolithus orientalis]|uniref:cyclin-domain-containing protein n=1 Tax=Pisolithus orientalis TaxID=936130 RepID=UPI0022241211|nr:cyclin-domain-containing protein [Pisolithus orientalis]KAI6033205.1 cyclin-domain-containing protein [Pisolithus orientalis]